MYGTKPSENEAFRAAIGDVRTVGGLRFGWVGYKSGASVISSWDQRASRVETGNKRLPWVFILFLRGELTAQYSMLVHTVTDWRTESGLRSRTRSSPSRTGTGSNPDQSWSLIELMRMGGWKLGTISFVTHTRKESQVDRSCVRPGSRSCSLPFDPGGLYKNNHRMSPRAP